MVRLSRLPRNLKRICRSAGQQQSSAQMYFNPEGSAASPGYSADTINPEVQKWFNAIDTDRSGKLTGKELQAALINAQGRTFSDEACRLMIALFDSDASGTIGISEFQRLHAYLGQWMDVFKTYDRDGSGYIEEDELTRALNQMGYRLSQEFVKLLVENDNADNQKRMSLDQFIVTCVKIQRLTNSFRMRDKDLQGVISISFEDFIRVVLTNYL